ncbi:MAG: regulatory protein RecX [Ferruginibacter sp.]
MKVNISEEKAWQKIKSYCAYQERCHREVKEKLYCLGLYKPQVEILLSRLIEENFLNEERFATAYAGGKFRVKQWGRVKIRYQLKQKGVSEFCIRKGLLSIERDDYYHTLKKLFENKQREIKESDLYKKKKTIQTYLMQKGYEMDEIRKMINEKPL